VKVFLRSFNPNIDIQSGASLPRGVKRGTPDWQKFEAILRQCLKDLGHELLEQCEGLKTDDQSQGTHFKIYVHQTKREIPNGDLFYMQTHLRELFTVDSLGWGADHSFMLGDPKWLEADLSKAEKFVESLHRRFMLTGDSKLPQPRWMPIQNYPDGCILVPLQMPNDTVIRHHSPFKVVDFVHLIADWAEAARQPVAFKMHAYTASERDIVEAVNSRVASGRYVFCVSGNIHYLIQRSMGVFTINSGAGFESLIHEKPVVTFGNCDYRWATFSGNSNNLDEARDYIFSHSIKLREDVCKFIYYYYHEHAYSVRKEHLARTKDRLNQYLRGVLERKP
jgi:hypothetical protein